MSDEQLTIFNAIQQPRYLAKQVSGDFWFVIDTLTGLDVTTGTEAFCREVAERRNYEAMTKQDELAIVRNLLEKSRQRDYGSPED